MKWKKKSMETSDRIVKGKPTAGTNGEVENLPDPQGAEVPAWEQKGKGRERESKEKVKVG